MDLHGQIMNILADANKAGTDDARLAYLHGHRDARHAAAELALKADACIEALRAIVEQQNTMGFDGSPCDDCMNAARKSLAVLDAGLGAG